MRFPTILILSAIILIQALTPLRAASLQMGVSVDVVPVGSDFNGADIVIFGSIEGAAQDPLYRGEYSVVIKIVGAPETLVIRQKERIAGIWVNNKSENYENVPSYYSVVASRPLSEVAPAGTLKMIGLGIDNLGAIPQQFDEPVFKLQPGEFSDALRRIRRENGLFAEDPKALENLSPTLFRATVSLPANVPIGEHTVTSYLFRDGILLASNENSFRIEKVGFERWIYNLAHEQSLIYGLMAVLMAIFTGWFANVIFRKN